MFYIYRESIYRLSLFDILVPKARMDKIGFIDILGLF